MLTQAGILALEIVQFTTAASEFLVSNLFSRIIIIVLCSSLRDTSISISKCHILLLEAQRKREGRMKIK